jgi:hypothetical protein
MKQKQPKAKVCKQCGEKFKPMNSLQNVCSPKCAIAFNSKKEIDKRVKVFRKETQSLSDLRAIARAAFQTWIRMRDQFKPCISCDKREAKWDGGHYMKAETYTGLIFNEDNCHKQCSYCNCQLDGNLIEYRKNLIKRIGQVRVDELEARADLSRIYKFSKQELIEIAQEYKMKIKQINETKAA